MITAEQIRGRVLRALERCEGRATRTELRRRVGPAVATPGLDEALAALVKAGEVRVEEYRPAAGPPGRVYWLTERPSTVEAQPVGEVRVNAQTAFVEALRTAGAMWGEDLLLSVSGRLPGVPLSELHSALSWCLEWDVLSRSESGRLVVGE